MTTPKHALFLTPEAPYPMTGGGAIRSASLLELLRQRYEVDVVSFAEFEAPGVRETIRLTLPSNARHVPARAWRNVSRYVRGVPPLVDRFRGFENQLTMALRGRRYAVGVIEHFWCAEYARVLRHVCDRLVLDLHNVESELHASGAEATSWPVSTMFRRFSDLYEILERRWLREFDSVLVTSTEDADRAKALGAVRTIVYPNALPWIAKPEVEEQDRILFSGNFEYHPNQSAVQWFGRNVWPRLRQAHPGLEWWLVGKNPGFAASMADGDPRIKRTGPVDDAVSVLATAKVCVAPILEGSGTRFKILEAWAAGRAVVSTTLGAEGLGGRDGEELLIADDPGRMAEAISALLTDEEKRRQIGTAGRSAYEKRFTWPVAWSSIGDL
ncbi:MAG: glycosyltransferase family 4 protein [Bryobacteraceae bacterium]